MKIDIFWIEKPFDEAASCQGGVGSRWHFYYVFKQWVNVQETETFLDDEYFLGQIFTPEKGNFDRQENLNHQKGEHPSVMSEPLRFFPTDKLWKRTLKTCFFCQGAAVG